MKATRDEFLLACKVHWAFCEAFLHLLDSKESKDVYAARFGEWVRNAVPAGLYEHWKSEDGSLKYYIVFNAGIEVDVYTPIVSYAALYRPHAAIPTFRHLLDRERGFLTPINREVYQGPRFRLVEKLSHKEIHILLQYGGELSMINDPVQFRLHASDLIKRSLPMF
jgi:hypothetical protein